jgi:hypothetical protein
MAVKFLMATILRLYSYLYHLVLALILLAISGVALASNVHTLNLPMFPWKGDELIHYLLMGGLVGLISVILAMTGVFKYLFPLWTLVVFVMMARGFLILPYTFSGKDEFYEILILIAGAFVAFLSSLTLFRSQNRRR